MRKYNVPISFWSAVTLSLGLLTACGNSTQPALPPGPYAITIKTSPTDTAAALEQRYQATVSAFHPESGFAVLGSEKAAQGAEVRAIEVDKNALIPPEISNAGVGGGTGWGGGQTDLGNPGGGGGGGSVGSNGQHTIRAESGVSSSGWNSWVSGWNSWVSGNAIPGAPIENREVFKSIGLSQAHQISRKFGEGVTVAVIDTGVDLNHSGIKNHLSPAADWRDFVDNDNLPQDETGTATGTPPAAAYGHGTAVAGIVLQIAPKATILPLRVLTPGGGGDLTDVIKAIDYAIEKGALVINLSLGSTKADVALQTELSYAKSKGVYVIASAGNNGLLDKTEYPAALSGRKDSELDVAGSTFGIGSINNAEALSSFTARGNGISAFAPGERIYSFYPNNRVAYATGTSFATPLVSGALALAASELPDQANRSKLGAVFEGSLEGTRIFKKYYDSQPDQRWLYGNGVLDVQRFILSLPGWNMAAPISQTNLLSNPGFELGPTDTNWVLQDAAIVQTEARTGNYSLAFLPTLKQYATNSIFELKPNTTYTLIAYFKTSSPDDLFCMTVSSFTADPVVEGYAVSCKKSQTYSLLSIRFTTDATRTGITVFAQINGSPSTGTVGAAYMDDTMVIETP
jgi:thermitase